LNINQAEYYKDKSNQRKPLKDKLEEETQEYINWLKKLIDMTYQDGVNAKRKIRIELQKKIDRYER
jgi:hypothetical protein